MTLAQISPVIGLGQACTLWNNNLILSGGLYENYAVSDVQVLDLRSEETSAGQIVRANATAMNFAT